MLTKAQIRQVIVERLAAVSGSCNSAHIDHNDGVFRGLIWALTGKDPGTYLTADVPSLCRSAGIDFTMRDGMVILPQEKTDA